MLHLENQHLRLDILDPVAEAAQQGTRYCWGGYIWQVHDRHAGPRLSGPEYPKPDPTAFNGQGLPESFRHRTRDGLPLTWKDHEGLAVGVGQLATVEKDQVALTARCTWAVARQPGQLVFQTRQSAAGFSYELTRRIELRDRTIESHSHLTNVGGSPLVLQWFAHPFWPLTAGRAHVSLPAGTTVPENPGFRLTADGALTFRRPFLTAADSQFALLTLPPDRALTLAINHPKLPRVTFATSFVPDECPVWANAHTLSVEPYLNLRLAPGETRHWHLRHGFAA